MLAPSHMEAGDGVSRFYLSPAVSSEKMLANMRSSLARGLPELKGCKPHGLTLSIAGGGPSLADTYREMEGYIAAVNGSLAFLLQHEIKEGSSYACGIMDAGAHIADMIVADRKVRYYVASICDPSVFDKLAGYDVVLWHVSPDTTQDPDGLRAVLDEAYPEQWHALGGGCTMGLRWINLGYFLGFRKFHLHGMDSSFRGGSTHAYPDRADTKDRIEFNGRETRPNFLAQVYDFFGVLNTFSMPECGPIEIKVFGDGLLQDEWKRRKSLSGEVLTACYDLSKSPPTYDFVSFLLGAEMVRLARGCKSIKVRIVPGPNEGFRADDLPPYGVTERQKMLREIVMPMTRLLPSCIGCEISEDWRAPEGHSFGFGEQRYGFRLQVEAAKRNIYPFRLPCAAPVAENYVTVTLRETEYWPSRNSNLAEWVEAAKEISRRGYRVIFVRDTAHAYEPIDGFYISHEAPNDIIARAKLYSGAEMNLFVNNGPAWLCMALGAPCLVMKMEAPDAPCVSTEFFTRCGLPPGSPWPNAKPRQRIGWADDTCDNIIHEFDQAI